MRLLGFGSVFSLGLLIAIAVTGCKEKNGLPVIAIHSGEISWGEKTPVIFTYTDAVASDSVSAKAKYRGGISRAYDKKSFRLKLPEKMALGGLEADNDWILNASYIDKTFMRHKLSFDLFREMNASNYAPHCAYAELYHNSEYAGLYIIMERPDATRLSVNKKDSTAFVFKEPPTFYDHTGGLDSDSLYRDAQKFPDVLKSDRSAYLRQLESLIREGDDRTFKAEIFNMLDKDNIIDWQLLLLLSNNSDGQHKNFYIYRTDSLSKARIALWDCDHGWGRDGDNEYNMLNRVIDPLRMTLFSRLASLNPDNFNEEMATRYASLREGPFSKAHLEHQILEIHHTIERYIENNAQCWPPDSPHYYDANDYWRELAILRSYVSLRIPQLDAYFGYTP
jgi:hypothetical protein